MSADMSSERVCYVQCNYCNTLLAVGVPNGHLLSMVTVRCGHCGNLLSVNMGGAMAHQSSSSLHPQPLQKQQQPTNAGAANNIGSPSTTCNRFGPLPTQNEQPRMPPIRPPEKRQRVPSAYNRFIKEEIQRIKASNPQISHREAFSAAAKNWAHFPNIHFGVKAANANKQAANASIAGGEGTHKSRGFY